MRTGAEYREAVRKGRRVWVMGEGLVEDVTVHPATRAMVDEYAAWYDRHLDPAWQDIVLTPPDARGERRPWGYVLPKSTSDLRGMGRSEAPDLGYSMGTYAEDLGGILDAIGVSRVVLCGISLGGYIAFEFLRRWRERVRGLILMDTRAEADSVEGRKSREALIGRIRDQGPIAAAEAMLPRFFTPQVSPDIIERIRTMILRTPVAGLVGALSAMRERPDSSSLLPTLTGIPTLVMVGAEDMITPPAVAQTMASAIPGARLMEIPGAGHLPCVEQPVPTTRAVLKFLQGLGA